MPPIRLPSSGSLAVPYEFGLPPYAVEASTGLLSCKPNKLPPGCTAAYRLAVESDKLRLLKAFAVLAFCAEITRLPNQMSDVTSSPSASDVVTAQIRPVPSTRVSHIAKPRPPFGVPEFGTTALRTFWSTAWWGSCSQVSARSAGDQP